MDFKYSEMRREMRFQGTHQEIGLQHGEQLGGAIEQVFDTYCNLWNLQPHQLSDRVAGYKMAIQRDFPHLAAEIAGIAEGSGMQEDHIYALNARTELFGGFSLLECTAVGVPGKSEKKGNVLIAQNWDWKGYLCDLTQIVDIDPDDKPRMKMLIEPGMVGKIGMNDQGVGVGLNFIYTERPSREGIPVHVLTRAVLECADYSQAEVMLQRAQRAANANYLVADSTGAMGNIEVTPDSYHVSSSDDIITHTNVSHDENCERKERFEEALGEYTALNGRISQRGIKKALRKEGVQFPITSDPKSTETIHTLVMNLTDGTMAVSGGARSNRFKTYGFQERKLLDRLLG
jgi:predicted choloylglycine hydrolase